MTDPRLAQLIRSSRSQMSYIKDVAVSNNGSYLAVGSNDAHARVFSLHTGEHVRTIEDEVSAGPARLDSFTNTATKPIMTKWPAAYQDHVFAVQFSPDGTELYVAGAEKEICAWALELQSETEAEN
jgi:WD40 repeat protein